MEKSQEEKTNFNPFFIHSTEPIHINFGRNTDGFEILACHLFYRPLTKKKMAYRDRSLGAPGDALITANVIRCIKERYPKLKINCITPHPELIRLDPNIDSINQPETFYSFDSTYWELIVRRKRAKTSSSTICSDSA